MNNDLDINPLISPEERMVTLAIKAGALVVATVMLGVVSCSMHSNAYEADVVTAEAKVQIEVTKATEANARVEIERIQALERMIGAGANPVAIRCMEEGWRDNSTCLAVGLAFGNTTNNFEE